MSKTNKMFSNSLIFFAVMFWLSFLFGCVLLDEMVYIQNEFVKTGGHEYPLYFKVECIIFAIMSASTIALFGSVADQCHTKSNSIKGD